MIYYEDQINWKENDYYALHSYLRHMLMNRRMYEIKSLDPCKMSEVTKVLIYCIVIYHEMSDILELENMKWLRDVKPLKEPLILNEEKSTEIHGDIYERMNVIR